ncbi:MAG: glucose-1-phosphate adenylyltransferase [Bacilli bacterium]|nr:glucose-1-phosphate adenylyltransferase [Bacilli bacterium]
MSRNVVGMILAGGKGTRLESLTKKTAKPAVSFAAKYRIIDFPLSNCANSGINTVGVLTQYESIDLDRYIGNGEKWGLNGARSYTASLAPRQTEEGAQWYKGTADAITQNIDFLDSVNPDYVLILSGDHIYKTTFNDMIDLHVSSGADATISVIEVDWKEASRFGIMSVDEKDQIVEFAEKPKQPKSNLASMGIYIFSWKTLREYLVADAKDPNSEHDFGKNIIPNYLNSGKKLQAYRFKGYWRDVGTLASLHEANMDVALNRSNLDIFERGSSRIYTEDTNSVPSYIGTKGSVSRSIVNQGAIILGSVDSCVISNEVMVDVGATCNRCVIMQNARVGIGAKVENAIIGPNTEIEDGAEINVGGSEVVLLTGKVGK